MDEFSIIFLSLVSLRGPVTSAFSLSHALVIQLHAIESRPLEGAVCDALN